MIHCFPFPARFQFWCRSALFIIWSRDYFFHYLTAVVLVMAIYGHGNQVMTIYSHHLIEYSKYSASPERASTKMAICISVCVACTNKSTILPWNIVCVIGSTPFEISMYPASRSVFPRPKK